MSTHKETRRKAERKAAKVERALELERQRRAAREVGPAAATPPPDSRSTPGPTTR